MALSSVSKKLLTSRNVQLMNVRTKMPPCFSPLCGLEIIPAPAHSAELCSVAKFLTRHFFADNPFSNAAGLAGAHKSFHNPVILDYHVKMMYQRKTIYAVVKESEDPLGVVIGSEATGSTAEEISALANRVTDPMSKKYLAFLASLEARANVYMTYSVPKVFKIEALCVAKEARRRGIGRKLLHAAKEMGFKMGYEVVRFDTGNFFAEKIAPEVGFKAFMRREPGSYKDDDGKPYLEHNFCPPHNEVVVFLARSPKVENTNTKKDKYACGIICEN
jgi:GNAT superfamily N-acetyltransferase